MEKHISDFVVSDSKTNYVDILMDSGAHIVVELYPEHAPLTVANFQHLVSQNFYAGVIFHRIIPDFMIQGGDPKGIGVGGSDQTIKGEFRSNGFNNNLRHTRGVLSMARTNNPNSASSQFFIMHANSPHLNGEYAAFGKVISGMEEVDRIAKLPRDNNDRPYEPPAMQKVSFLSLKQ